MSDTKQAILGAARAQVERGEELSIQRIAAEVGISRQTVHARFGGVRGLRAALAAEGLAIEAHDQPTSERLVDAATRLLSRPGAGQVSIEAIAAEAGLTKGAFYHYFADRRELLRAVARSVSPVAEMRGMIEPLASAPPRDGLIAVAKAYYSAMRARADLVRNLAANAGQDPELTGSMLTEFIGEGAPMLFRWFDHHVQQGRLRPVDPTLVMQALVGPVFLAIVLGPAIFDDLARFGIHPAVDNVEAYVDVLLSGIEPPRTAAGGNR